MLMPGLEPRLEPGLLMIRTGVRTGVLKLQAVLFFFFQSSYLVVKLFQACLAETKETG